MINYDAFFPSEKQYYMENVMEWAATKTKYCAKDKEGNQCQRTFKTAMGLRNHVRLAHKICPHASKTLDFRSCSDESVSNL